MNESSKMNGRVVVPQVYVPPGRREAMQARAVGGRPQVAVPPVFKPQAAGGLARRGQLQPSIPVQPKNAPQVPSPRQPGQALHSAARSGRSLVIQRLPVGDYITTDTGHLRDQQSKATLADIPARTTVKSLGTTSRFDLGFFSFAKDHTLVRVPGIGTGWMRDEILQQMPPQAITTTTTTTTPFVAMPTPTLSMAIPTSGGGRPRPAPVASSLGKFKAGYPKVASVSVTSQQKLAFEDLYVYMHFTQPEYRGSIHMKGLIAGAGEGIGLPSDEGKGPSDKQNIYVVSGSPESNPATKGFVSMEAGPADVVVISRNRAVDPDTNYRTAPGYPNRGAYLLSAQIPPGRHYAGGTSTISLVLPLTNSAKTGLASFINERLPTDEHVSGAQAEFLLARKLFQLYPMRYMSYGSG